METHELIASLEARATEEDTLIQALIASLKARQAANDDIEQVTLHHMKLRRHRTSLIVEAAFALKDQKEAATRRHLYSLFGF